VTEVAESPAGVARFAVVVTFRAREGELDRVRSELARNARDSLSEPGCLEFVVLQDAEDEREFLLYERYRDARAFHEEHMATEHYARWKKVAQRCLEPGSQARRELRPVEGGTA